MEDAMHDNLSLPFKRAFAHYDMGQGEILEVRDYRDIGQGFTGRFCLRRDGHLMLPIVETGACPGEVITKLARVPELAAHKQRILEIPLCELDYTA